MIDIEKDEFKIGFDENTGFIRVKNPIEDDAIADMYENKYHENNQGISDNLTYSTWEESGFYDKFTTFEKHIPAQETRSLLDIGCGLGKLLLYGKERNWNCVGVEPSKQAANCALSNGLNVLNCNFSKDLFTKNEKFDVVHMHHVLEHIKNPIDLLNDAKELLKENGILCVIVPNDFSAFQTILWKELDFKPWWIAPEHHLNYFDFNTLSSLLENNGFEIVLKETSFPMELFLLFGEDYIKQPEIGTQSHLKRTNFDTILRKYDNELKRKFYQSLANIGIGRDVILYAKKKISE